MICFDGFLRFLSVGLLRIRWVARTAYLVKYLYFIRIQPIKVMNRMSPSLWVFRSGFPVFVVIALLLGWCRLLSAPYPADGLKVEWVQPMG